MLTRYFTICLLAFLSSSVHAQPDVFFGPFKSWANLKQQYHAFGDGKHDDTRIIQAALDDLGTAGHSPVLFIPAGTYRITATLKMQTRKDIAIIGESPETTIIKWDGDSAMKMFALNGVSYSEYSRLTWDGSNKALAAFAHEWDGKVHYANSGTQHNDEIFKNIQVGLKSGANMDAEFTIRRCRFYNCTSTGISLQGFNALDWWVWDCYFENCKNGLSNFFPTNGAGNFHAYRCIFKNSSNADISMGNSEFFSFRDNISYNSNCFIAASQWSNTSPITIQGNTIINARLDNMAYLFTKGNVLFLDNTFITPDSGKYYVINNSDSYKNSGPDLTLIGNSFKAKQKTYFNSGGRVLAIDNKTLGSMKALPDMNPKPFALPANYPIVEVNNKMTADEIQSLIDKATAAKKKTIIHFNYGNYNISKTLHIASNAEIILLGDGLASVLNWIGDANNNAIIEIDAPAKARLQNLYFNGNRKADCIKINDDDKNGNSIYGDEVMLYHGVETNLLVNGFSKTDFRFDDFQHNYCNTGTSIKLIGTNDNNAALVKIFGGESSNDGNSYSLSKGSRILLFDVWYENSNISRFMKLRDKGEFILNGGKIANVNQLHEPFIDIDSFSGKITLSEIIFNQPKKTLHFNDRYGTASLLALGNLSWTDSTNVFFDNQSKNKNYAMLNNRYNTGKGSYPLANLGDTSNTFLLKMLATPRQTSVSEKPKTGDKTNSHLVLQRLMIESGINNLRIERSK